MRLFATLSCLLSLVSGGCTPEITDSAQVPVQGKKEPVARFTAGHIGGALEDPFNPVFYTSSDKGFQKWEGVFSITMDPKPRTTRLPSDTPRGVRYAFSGFRDSGVLYAAHERFLNFSYHLIFTDSEVELAFHFPEATTFDPETNTYVVKYDHGEAIVQFRRKPTGIFKASAREYRLTLPAKSKQSAWAGILYDVIVSFSTVTQQPGRQVTRAPAIVVDGPEEDQKFIKFAETVVRSLPEYGYPAGPFGASNPRFNGHIFWDSDTWMLPACLIINPDAAKVIADYRIKMAPAANRRFRDWASQLPHAAKADLKTNGVRYPWESDTRGHEASPTETKDEDHVTASVLRGLDQAAAFGLADEQEVQKIGAMAANYYLLRSTRDAKGVHHINRTISPSELHIADDDLYTNVSAEWVVSRYSKQKTKFHRPRDGKTFLTFMGDHIGEYQQAAALLAIFPAQDPEVERESAQMYDRFHDKVTKFGPAMSDSVHSIIAARLGRTEKAYRDWHDSWKPYLDENEVFREKLPAGEGIFLTGVAGSLNSVLYGFAGLRIDTKAVPGAKWSMPLKNGYILSCRPNLPPKWKSIRLENLRVLDREFTLTVYQDRVLYQKMPESPGDLPAKLR